MSTVYVHEKPDQGAGRTASKITVFLNEFNELIQIQRDVSSSSFSIDFPCVFDQLPTEKEQADLRAAFDAFYKEDGSGKAEYPPSYGSTDGSLTSDDQFSLRARFAWIDMADRVCGEIDAEEKVIKDAKEGDDGDKEKQGSARIGELLKGKLPLEWKIRYLIRNNQPDKAVRLIQKAMERSRSPASMMEILGVAHVAKQEFIAMQFWGDLAELESTVLIADMHSGTDMHRNQHVVIDYSLFTSASIPRSRRALSGSPALPGAAGAYAPTLDNSRLKVIHAASSIDRVHKADVGGANYGKGLDSVLAPSSFDAGTVRQPRETASPLGDLKIVKSSKKMIVSDALNIEKTMVPVSSKAGFERVFVRDSVNNSVETRDVTKQPDFKVKPECKAVFLERAHVVSYSHEKKIYEQEPLVLSKSFEFYTKPVSRDTVDNYAGENTRATEKRGAPILDAGETSPEQRVVNLVKEGKPGKAVELFQKMLEDAGSDKKALETLLELAGDLLDLLESRGHDHEAEDLKKRLGIEKPSLLTWLGLAA